jgi:dihydrofolate reductase
MSRLRAMCIGMSLDGYAAGPDQSREHPLGVRGEEIMSWVFPTHQFLSMYGKGAGETGIDNSAAEASFVNMGAWILGRNMFSASRGPWPDDGWKGWWGDNPPYHVPTFVLTHYAHDPIEMKGGTTFHFVTGGIHEALERAREAAGGKDIRVGGGASTIRQYLEARLLDDLHLAVRPVVLGKGEPLFRGLDLDALGYECEKSVAGERATHFYIRRRA